MLVKILTICPIQEREYIDKNGNNAVFRSMGIVFVGLDCNFYAEAIQEMVPSVEAMKLKSGDKVNIRITTMCRSYKTAAGETRYSNEITLRNIQKW